MTTAAIFDLDRTVLGGASGPVISGALRDVGLMRGSVPGERLVFSLFDAVGELYPSMLLTRQGVRAAKGWSQDAVREAGRLAAPELLDRVQPHVPRLLDDHRRAGRRLVLATTTPHDVVAEFSERLGMDALLATRYRATDGVYDGSFDGPFVWGRGKLSIVRAWARDNDVDLAGSYAYSDSFYDLPLLNAVGHPVPVNPDPRLTAIASLRRWPIRYLDAPEGVQKLVGIELQQAAFPLARNEVHTYADIQLEGQDHIPRCGGVILAANHRSYFDPIVIWYAAAQQGRPVRFLGKKELFESAPFAGSVMSALGVIKVDRGSGSEAPLRSAADALAGGEAVVVLPQGTIPRGPDFFEPNLKGRPGIGRLAAMTDAPVIPIGLWGTERVWPRSSRVPNVLPHRDPPAVAVRVGEPVELSRDDAVADTGRVMAAITDLLPAEAREHHEPSDEELARTYPPG